MLQVKLLRVLQEKEIVRLGGVDVIYVDVRIIAATNEDLPSIVREGGFRKDLFYRLSVLPLSLPPLRERGEDVQLLFGEIRRGLGAEFALSPAALAILMAHPWDGNVRELHNCVEYLAYLDKPVIQPEDLPATILAQAAPDAVPLQGAGEPLPPIPPVSPIAPLPPLAQGGAKSVAERLRRQAGRELPACRFILAQLQNTFSLGRKSLAALAAAEGLPATEQTIRTALLRLEELKLVEVRRGRAGSRLTPLGEAVLGVLGDK